MYPRIFGFDNSSYIFFFVLGIIAAFIVALIYLKKNGFKKSMVLDLLICLLCAIVFGVIFAILFENLYEAIALKGAYTWVWKMTFFGGLLGGVGGFLFSYFFLTRKTELEIKSLVIIAPACISIAHAIGRIGCFLEGCCYGKHTDSWIGLEFPGLGKVIPTQLIEAIFLFILSAVLIVLAFKFHFKYNFLVYLFTYSVFRFVIEFYRADDRGAFLGPFSPSQVWCLVLFVMIIPFYFILKKVSNDGHRKEEKTV